MATINFTQPASMATPYYWQTTNTTAVSNTQINITDNVAFSAIFYGSFTFSTTYLSGGTVTGIDIYHNGSLEYTVANASLDAITINNDIADIFNPLAFQRYIFSGDDVITGTSSADKIYGWNGNDVLKGLGGNDYLDDDIGDNYFDGGVGADTMSGGGGSDTYIVDNIADVVLDQGGNNKNYVYSSVSLDGANFNPYFYADIYLTGTDNINVKGFQNSNLQGYQLIVGNVGNNILQGQANSTGVLLNHDVLIGGLGDDTYVMDQGDVITELFGEGVDTVITNLQGTWNHSYILGDNLENLITNYVGTGNALDNTITGGIYSDTLNGMAGNDTLIGGIGTDTLIGGLGDDTLRGGDQADNLQGGDGNDTISGGKGFDTLDGGTGNDTLLGLLGNDLLLGGDGFDYLDGGDGNDNLNGGLNGDTLIGGLGDDVLSGGKGMDILNGGVGSDTLTGGLGVDHFIFNQAIAGVVNTDTITDFQTGSDVIELSASIFTYYAGQIGSTIGISDYLTYDNTTGVTAYDADGTGAGSAYAVAIIGASSHPTTMGNDFLIVA